MSFPIQKIIDQAIAEGNKREKKERTGWYISEIGYCPRMLFFKRQGLEPDDPIDARTMRVFEVGKRDENFILQDIEKFVGKDIEGFDKKIVKAEREVRVEDKDLNVSGRIDDMLTYSDNTKELLEVKSKHSKSFWYMDKQGKGASEPNVWQLWLYLWLTGIDRGQVVYVSKDDLSILQYPVLRETEALKEKVLGRIKFLNEMWEKKQLPEPLENPTWECQYCQYNKTCGQVKNNKNKKVITI